MPALAHQQQPDLLRPRVTTIVALLLYAVIVACALYRLLRGRLSAKHRLSALKANFFQFTALFATARVISEGFQASLIFHADAQMPRSVLNNRYRIVDDAAQCFFFSTYMSLALYLLVNSSDSALDVQRKVFFFRVYWVSSVLFYLTVLALYVVEVVKYGLTSHDDPILRYSAGVITAGSIVCKVGFLFVGLRLHAMVRHFVRKGRGRLFSPRSQRAVVHASRRLVGTLGLCTLLFLWRDTVYVSFSITGSDHLGDITRRPVSDYMATILYILLPEIPSTLLLLHLMWGKEPMAAWEVVEEMREAAAGQSLLTRSLLPPAPRSPQRTVLSFSDDDGGGGHSESHSDSDASLEG
eukprot:g5560.t1